MNVTGKYHRKQRYTLSVFFIKTTNLIFHTVNKLSQIPIFYGFENKPFNTTTCLKLEPRINIYFNLRIKEVYERRG